MSRFGCALAGLALVLATFACSRSEDPGEAEGAVATEVAVHVGTIERATLHRYVTVYGRLEPAPATRSRPPARAEVASAADGLLVSVDCVEGERVAKGSTLFRLDSRTAEVAVAKAAQELDFAETFLARKRELLGAGGASERDVLEARTRRDTARSDLEAAKTQRALLEATAPIDGTVVRIDARLGQSVDRASVLAEIVDLERLVLHAAVPRSEAGVLAPGQEVVLGEGLSETGEVLFIGHEVDPATDAVEVRASVPRALQAQVGQFLAARIVTDEQSDCLAVPVQSLVREGDADAWIAVVEGDRAHRVAVTDGVREGGLVEVSGEGLHEGMQIVTDGAYGLPEQTKIRVLAGG